MEVVLRKNFRKFETGTIDKEYMVGKVSRKFSVLNFRKLPFSYESQMGQKLL